MEIYQTTEDKLCLFGGFGGGLFAFACFSVLLGFCLVPVIVWTEVGLDIFQTAWFNKTYILTHTMAQNPPV